MLRLASILIALACLSLCSYAQHNVASCSGSLNCLVSAAPAGPDPSSLEEITLLTNSSGLVPIQVRMSNIGGPFAHKWVQIGTEDNAVTFGYGAADFPLIDSGQIVVTDRKGVELVSRWHFLPGRITPAEAPDRGRTVGPPVYITVRKRRKSCSTNVATALSSRIFRSFMTATHTPVPSWRLRKGDQHCPVISFSKGISRSELRWVSGGLGKN